MDLKSLKNVVFHYSYSANNDFGKVEFKIEVYDQDKGTTFVTHKNEKPQLLGCFNNEDFEKAGVKDLKDVGFFFLKIYGVDQESILDFPKQDDQIVLVIEEDNKSYSTFIFSKDEFTSSEALHKQDKAVQHHS